MDEWMGGWREGGRNEWMDSKAICLVMLWQTGQNFCQSGLFSTARPDGSSVEYGLREWSASFIIATSSARCGGSERLGAGEWKILEATRVILVVCFLSKELFSHHDSLFVFVCFYSTIVVFHLARRAGLCRANVNFHYKLNSVKQRHFDISLFSFHSAHVFHLVALTKLHYMLALDASLK